MTADRGDAPPPTSPSNVPPGCLVPALIGGAGALLALILAWALLTGGENPPAGSTPGGSSPPAETPTGTPQWTVGLVPEAGGWRLVSSGSPEDAQRAGAMVRTGIGVRNFVSGRYEDPSQAAVLSFYGAELDPPLPPERVGQEARPLLEAAFEANFRNLTPAGEPRRYEAGPPGGELWCVSYDTGSHACGWVDEWTIGFVFAVIGEEAETSAQLTQMRADLETRG